MKPAVGEVERLTGISYQKEVNAAWKLYATRGGERSRSTKSSSNKVSLRHAGKVMTCKHLLDVLHLVSDRNAIRALLHVVQLVEKPARELVQQGH